MIDLLLIFTGLFLFTLFGYLPSELLRDQDIKGKVLIAPVIGFGLFGIVSTILYSYELAPFYSLMLLSIISTICVFYWFLYCKRFSIKVTKDNILFFVFLLLTILICILPKWFGGDQFSLFQANAIDQFNYLSEAHSYQYYSYKTLQTLSNNLDNSIFLTGKTNLSNRPTVAIVLAALTSLIKSTNFSASYAYMVLLQINIFFVSTFFIINIFNLRTIIAYLISLGLTIGFFQQYIFDLNAWSQLACMPIAFLSVIVTLYIFFPSKKSISNNFFYKNIIALTCLLALIFSEIFFYYPEIIPAYLLPIVTIIALALFTSPNKTYFRVNLVCFVCSLGLSLLVCTFYWQGTVEFLFKQIAFGKDNSITTNLWALNYDNFVFGRELFPLRYNSHYFIYLSWPTLSLSLFLTWPIDIFMSIIGLYYVLPDEGSSIVLRVLMRIIFAIFILTVIYGTFQTISSLRENKIQAGKKIFFLSAISVLFLPLILVVDHNFWIAGKFYSMTSPFVFFLVLAPLLNNYQSIKFKKITRYALCFYLIAYLGFGLIRPLAATNSSGVHYLPPYPSMLPFKKLYSWDFAAIVPTLKQCNSVEIDVKSPIVQTYAEIFLSELGYKWTAKSQEDNYNIFGQNYEQETKGFDCRFTLEQGIAKVVKLKHEK
jgi:hypothetical protein